MCLVRAGRAVAVWVTIRCAMKKLGKDIEYLIASLSADSDQARINLRAHQVRSRYRQALESVYRESAPLFLEHTNNVYIMRKDGIPTLIVYVDESIFAAELNAQRELIKLKLLELFGEQIEQFEIYVSRGDYKNHHPYSEEGATSAAAIPLPELTEEGRARVSELGAKVEDPGVRASLEKAMTADMARKSVENGTQS